MNVLLSSAGRRVSLLNLFQKALQRSASAGRVIAADASESAPAAYVADGFFRVPSCTDSEFFPKVLEICRHQEIRLIVAVIDAELSVFARNRERLRELEISVAVSSLEAVELTADKAATHDWLAARGFAVPEQTRIAGGSRVPADLWRSLPLVAKPRIGSSAIGVRYLRHQAELDGFVAPGDTVVEELLDGDEYTVNVYVDRAGRSLCAVPHRRTAVRAGEVSKAVTAKREDIIQLASSIAEHLPGAYGPINVQIFASKGGELKVTEINPRFSGGYPLAEFAGTRFPEWLIREARGESLSEVQPDWQDGVSMLRFDQEIFVDGSGNLLAAGHQRAEGFGV